MQVKLLKGRTNMYGKKLEDKTLQWNSNKTNNGTKQETDVLSVL